MIDLKGIIQRKIMNDEEERRRAKEELGSFHCSGLGYCARQIFLNKIHAKYFDLNIKGSMSVGSAIHHYIQWFKDIKDVCEVEVPLKYMIEGSEAFLVGSADLVAKDRSMVCDIKSINGLNYVFASPMAEHIVQVNTYLKCLDIQDGQILYVNKPNMEMVVHNIKYNEVIFQQTIMKVLTVFEALKRWENDGAFNNPIPFKPCGCWACRNETLHPDIIKLINKGE